MLAAEGCQFRLDRFGFLLQGRSLLRQEGDAIGESLLTLLQGGLEIGVADRREQGFIFHRVPARDADVKNARGFPSAGATGADLDPIGQGAAAEIEALGNRFEQQRTLKQCNQSWNVIGGCIESQLLKHLAAGGS